MSTKFDAIEQHSLVSRDKILERARSELKDSCDIWYVLALQPRLLDPEVYISRVANHNTFIDVDAQYADVADRLKKAHADLSLENATINTALRQVIRHHDETSIAKKMPKSFFQSRSAGPTFAALEVTRRGE